MVEYSAQNPARVLLVDDSTVIRKTLTKILSSYQEIALVGEASNGQQAIDIVPDVSPDIILLDIEMPIMDGMEALPHLLSTSPTSKIIVLSTLTRKNAALSFRALEIGAADYMEKPHANESLHSFAELLRNKIIAIASSAQPETIAKEVAPAATEEKPLVSFQLAAEKSYPRPKILAIGASTGGPPALTKVLKAISADVSNIPIIITQHIPKEFDVLFAETLTKSTNIPCCIPTEGQRIEPGHAYIAPGDYHIEVISGADNTPKIHLSQTEKEHFCRPSVNPMLRSLEAIYHDRILMVMLTGMGSDGIEGAKILHDAGAQVIAQDETTSAVWGMPGAVAKAGICSHVLPIDKLPKKIIERIKG
jgi:two-component system chemotaxis response regulator CheB